MPYGWEGIHCQELHEDGCPRLNMAWRKTMVHERRAGNQQLWKYITETPSATLSTLDPEWVGVKTNVQFVQPWALSDYALYIVGNWIVSEPCYFTAYRCADLQSYKSCDPTRSSPHHFSPMLTVQYRIGSARGWTFSKDFGSPSHLHRDREISNLLKSHVFSLAISNTSSCINRDFVTFRLCLSKGRCFQTF